MPLFPVLCVFSVWQSRQGPCITVDLTEVSLTRGPPTLFPHDVFIEAGCLNFSRQGAAYYTL